MSATKEKKSNELLRNEQLGSPISEQLSNYLRAYTSSNDRANVSIETGIGSSTIRDVSYRNNNLTEDNSRAIAALVKIAIDNCEISMKKAAKTAKELKSILR